MGIIKLKNKEKNEILVESGTPFYKIIEDYDLKKSLPVVLAKLNDEYFELTSKVQDEGNLETVDISTNIGMRIYVRTLQFILIKAVLDIFSGAKITIEHSLSKGLYGEVHKDTPLTTLDIEKIKGKMNEIIREDIPIKKISISREEAIKIFEKYNMQDKIRILKQGNSSEVKLYELDGLYDYFYGSMAHSTGAIKVFDLINYEAGFLLRFPTESDPLKLPKFIQDKKLSKIFKETENWVSILGVGDVGSLNNIVASGEIMDFIRVNEALHEKKIAYIADMISEREDVKIILIAGPSSSGKTTFAKRLGIQLRVNGLLPIPISLDDYFVDREDTPKDENGEYNFESIYALDLKLFNKNLEELLRGDYAQIPSFNFKTGKRVQGEEKIKLPQNGVIIVEGIHGLNEILTSSIPKENKFKIYISALTQLNLDDHNRIATTDVRIIRRIVRDFLSRGYNGEDTLKMWPSIKRGEEENIFVYQENADVMFNSTLVYELCVLKKFALEELDKIHKNSSVYYEALRLKSFLNFFKDLDMSLVPDNSILREFIGGSCFYKY